MTPDEASRSMQTARTYKVQGKEKEMNNDSSGISNGIILSLIYTLAKVVASNSRNLARLEDLREKVLNTLEDRINMVFSDGDSVRVADKAYRVNCDLIICGNCAKVWSLRDNPRYDSERVDSPVHCTECESLLPCDLTGYGRSHVAREIAQYLHEPSQYDRPRILRTWAIYYDHNVSIVEMVTDYIVSDRVETEDRERVKDTVRALMEARGII